MSPLWIVEAVLLVAGPVGLWHARPRGPWPIHRARFRYATVQFSVNVAAFVEAMKKASIAANAFEAGMLRVSHTIRATAMSSGTHSGGAPSPRRSLAEVMDSMSELLDDGFSPDAARWRPDIEGAP